MTDDRGGGHKDGGCDQSPDAFATHPTARQLLDLAAEVGDEIPAVIRISHEALADAIGSRREVVSRALGTLATAGAIGLGRRSITVRDAGALRNFVSSGERGTPQRTGQP